MSEIMDITRNKMNFPEYLGARLVIPFYLLRLNRMLKQIRRHTPTEEFSGDLSKIVTDNWCERNIIKAIYGGERPDSEGFLSALREEILISYTTEAQLAVFGDNLLSYLKQAASCRRR